MTAPRPSARRSTAELLGYDPALLDRLPPSLRQGLEALSQAWLVSCTLLAFPMGLAVWLVEHSFALSFFVSVGTFILVLNLLRLLNSGSGTAPELPLKKGYRPSLTPMMMLLGLSLIMSQPAQLLHATNEVREKIASHRQELLESHRAVVAEVGGAAEDAFTREIEECEFVVLRLSLLWNTPQSTLLWTLVYVGLCMLPAALARTSYLRASRAYERIRYRTAGRRLKKMVSDTERAVRAALRSYPTYREPWPFAPEPPLAAAPSPDASAQGARR